MKVSETNKREQVSGNSERNAERRKEEEGTSGGKRLRELQKEKIV